MSSLVRGFSFDRNTGFIYGLIERLSENVHLPFDTPFDRLTVLSRVEGLTALSKVEGLRYPHPSSLRRTSMYASFLGISEALHLDIFHQPLRSRFFDCLASQGGNQPDPDYASREEECRR
jgi:hypothetical protein